MIWLAFRKALTIHSGWRDRLVTWWTRCEYGHVEMILEIKCPGARNCTYCQKTQATSAPEGHKHYINISVTHEDPVFYCIDRKFDEDEQKWIFLQLPVDGSDTVCNIVEFIQRQLDKDYNHSGCCCNLVCCCFGNWCGASKKTDATSSEKDSSKWFCSELIVAALQEGGYHREFDMEPRLTTPQHLFNMASKCVGTKVTHHPRTALHHQKIKQQEMLNQRLSQRNDATYNINFNSSSERRQRY